MNIIFTKRNEKRTKYPYVQKFFSIIEEIHEKTNQIRHRTQQKKTGDNITQNKRRPVRRNMHMYKAMIK
jgi:hypothetical protein